MYTIDHAEKALQQCHQNEKTLLQYSIAVQEELCAMNGIEVDKGSKPLKKPYIKALLGYSKKQECVINYVEDRARKRKHCDTPPTNITDREGQRHSKEPNTIQLAPPTIVHMDVDAASISHGTNNSRRDTASASTDQPVRLPGANAAPILDLASQSNTTAIPSKRSYPFVKKKGS
ncbi:hypothetical protein EI94DRAFT_1707346 [Lactarius quietus]|nr:hypothetical protein EI94DRAFT_1707346 [Lactarius quietus]